MTTRLWFTAAAPAPVAPAFDASWDDASHGARFQLSAAKGASPITVGAKIAWVGAPTGRLALDRQYVSPPMPAGVVFSPADQGNGQLMVREYAASDNVNQIIAGIRVVGRDGAATKAILIPVMGHGPVSEFINRASHRNKRVFETQPIAGYTTADGDRLVVEIGYTNFGTGSTTPQVTAKWGEGAPDLPVDEAQTADGSGWIELATAIAFLTE